MPAWSSWPTAARPRRAGWNVSSPAIRAWASPGTPTPVIPRPWSTAAGTAWTCPWDEALTSKYVRLLLLALSLGALFLPPLWAALILGAAFVAGMAIGPPRREKVVGGIAMAVVLGALALEWSGERMARTPPREWAESAADEYADLWDGLGGEAGGAAEALGSAPEGQDATMRAFRRLAELVSERGDQAARGRRALLLLDPDGEAIAWSGEGLLHEPSADEVPRSGRAFQASFTAVTLLAVEPLPSD